MFPEQPVLPQPLLPRPLGPVLPQGGPGSGGQVGGYAGPIPVPVVLVVLSGVLSCDTSAAPTPVSLRAYGFLVLGGPAVTQDI